MDTLRPFPLHENALPAAITNVVNSHNIIAGKGIKVKHDSAGFHVSVNGVNKHEPMVSRGNYDPTLEYFPNEVVNVNPALTYTNPLNGQTLSFTTGSPVLGVGSWVCLQYVPPSINSSSYFLNTVVPAYTTNKGTANDIDANCYRWYQYNNYFPTASVLVSSSVHDGSGYNIIASQSFWSPLSPPPTSSAAPIGTNVGYFAISGLSTASYVMAMPLTITYPSGALQVKFGSPIQVMKPNRQRQIASEIFDGVTITYSNYNDDNTRQASDGTNLEWQVCYPRYITYQTLGLSVGTGSIAGSSALNFLNSQCVITAAQTNTTALSSANWEEISTRVWARRFTQ